MYIQYRKEYSSFLGRDMEFKIYGTGGRPVLALPCRKGRFFDWEEGGMIQALKDYLDQERLQVFTPDTIDAETVSNRWGDPYHRVRLHEAWYHYVVDELLPLMQACNGSGLAPVVIGCDMGAYHAANFFLRRPELFHGLIALSGLYHTYHMHNGYMDEVVYANDPCVSLSGMSKDHPYIARFNARRMVFCSGRGAWEEQAEAYTQRLEQVLEGKGIRAWVDYWGGDSDHNWRWWQRQLRYFLPYVLNDPDHFRQEDLLIYPTPGRGMPKED